jgi:BsuBI/PstI restriction endonuclease domain/BsuBI/PstI restriction endonuclease HTH domain
MSYFSKSRKSKNTVKLLEEAVSILVAVGLPINGKTERSLERMAMAFMAVAGVTNEWKTASDNRNLKTRDIIDFVNEHFEESMSSVSYDDIRRKDLKLLLVAGLVLNSSDKPNAATNDPKRGYSLSTDFMTLVQCYGTVSWTVNIDNFLSNQKTLDSILSRQRNLDRVAVTLPTTGIELSLSTGKHNELQKAIIEEFLPRYGHGCEVLYIGDTANKMLHIDAKKLEGLNFFELSHDELPDIIAYNHTRNWLYLIEAVHSGGTISEIRMLELKRLTQPCKAEIIYVTAFLSKSEFRKWAAEIAWETEVWIAENPDHLIHFNGNKFLGPYKELET